MPRPPRRLEHLYARLPRVTQAVFGVRSYLREVDDSESPGTGLLAAFSFPPGVLELRPSAARRLRRLVEGAPVATPGLRRMIATDLLTLLHEAVHALGPDDRDAMERSFGGSTDVERVFSEGSAEWAARRHLPDVIRGLGLAADHPWLLDVEPAPSYPVPAAVAGVLIEHLAAISGRTVTAECAALLRAGIPGGALDVMSRQWAAAGGRPDQAAVARRALVRAIAHTTRYAVPPEAARLAARRAVARIDARLGVDVRSITGRGIAA